MCVIFELKPGQNIDDERLDNAVANNWHGYGIILKDEGAKRLEVRQNFSSDKGADPEEVARILKDNDDVTRYVHLRHNTAGADGLDNCHPFPVFHSDSRQSYLFHNGTIYDYKPKGDDKRSDTRIFCEEFVSDLLLHFEGEYGKGDYNYPIIKQILEKQVGPANKLLLVSNDLDPLFCNEWKEIYNKNEGGSFKASNNDYFYMIKRGPRYSHVPFRQTNHAVVPFKPAGTNLKNGSTTEKPTEVATEKPNSFPIKQESTETLVEEAKKARVLVPLAEVEQKKSPWFPPKAMLECLGVSKKIFTDFGFQCIDWIKDEEMEAMLRSVSPHVIGELIRDLTSTAMTFAEENDLAEQAVVTLEMENESLKKALAEMGEELQTVTLKHDKATKRIATMEADVTYTQVRKVG